LTSQLIQTIKNKSRVHGWAFFEL